MKTIKVVIIEDSILAADIIKDTLELSQEIEVIGVAKTGIEGIQFAKNLTPDVITVDMQLPDMDGLDVIKEIMRDSPTPILVLSETSKKENNGVFDAISLGAVDVMDKSALNDRNTTESELIQKIKLASGIHVVRHNYKYKINRPASRNEFIALPSIEGRNSADNIIGIVSSTGGPEVLKTILEDLPANFSASVLIVQHITSGFGTSLASWLNDHCELDVEVATHGKTVAPGTIFIAPSNTYVRVTSKGCLDVFPKKTEDSKFDMGNELLTSLGDHFGEDAFGLILTGMGNDGAAGMKHLHDKGGYTCTQDLKSSIIPNMPKSAQKLNAVDKVLSPDKITLELITWLKSKENKGR